MESSKRQVSEPDIDRMAKDIVSQIGNQDIISMMSPQMQEVQRLLNTSFIKSILIIY